MAGSSRQGWAGPQGRPGVLEVRHRLGRLALRKTVGGKKKDAHVFGLPASSQPLGQGQACGPQTPAQSRLSFQPRPRLPPPPPSCPWASPHLPSLSCQKTLSKMQTVQALAGLKFLSQSNLLSVALTLSPAHLLGQRMSC